MQINNDINLFFSRIGCEFQNGCPNGTCRGDTEEYNCEESETSADDPQILRHLVFLILLLCSMFIVRKLLLFHTHATLFSSL